jgi:hypothetical protein
MKIHSGSHREAYKQGAIHALTVMADEVAKRPEVKMTGRDVAAMLRHAAADYSARTLTSTLQ